ncbi:MAG: universal stress protein [Armatimonadota bacterium]
MFRSILVGYDDSHTARTVLRQAIDIADASSAWLQICYVEDIEEPAEELLDGSVTPDEIAMPEGDIEEELQESAEPALDDRGPVLQEAADSCVDENIPFVTRHIFGRFGERIAGIAYFHDFVMVGQSRDVNRGQRHRVGPHISHLLWKCPVPMLLADSEYHMPVAATLIFENNAFGGRALRIATVLCDMLDLDLHVALAKDAAGETNSIEAEIQYAMKPHDISWDLHTFESSLVQTVYSANRHWEDELIVLPRPAKPWPWSTTTLDAAVSLPDAMKLVVP